MHYSDGLENIDWQYVKYTESRYIITCQVLNCKHLILFIEHGGLKKKVFSKVKRGQNLAYNEIFFAF